MERVLTCIMQVYSSLSTLKSCGNRCDFITKMYYKNEMAKWLFYKFV